MKQKLKDKLNSKKSIKIANICNVVFWSLCFIATIIVQTIKGFTVESILWLVCAIAFISLYEFGIKKLIFKISNIVLVYTLNIIIPLVCIVLSCIFAPMWAAVGIIFATMLIVYIASFILKPKVRQY